MDLLEIFRNPWPWYVSGILIGLTVPGLLFLGSKRLSISSNLRHICAVFFPGNIDFFKYDWKSQRWNMYFAGGIFIGGLIANTWFTDVNPNDISEKTITSLNALGVQDFKNILPIDIFSWSSLFTLRGFIFIVIGGFLVGFGTRYAGGCLAGHSIMGLSNLEWTSLVVTFFFMVGGILTTHFLLPFLLSIN